MPIKGCSLDPLPTDMVKEYAEWSIVPLVTSIINESLKSGVVPAQLKQAIIVPILKKSGLDLNILKNFRPIFHLNFLSKILEKVVLGVSFSNIYLTTSFWKFTNLPTGRAIAWRPQYWVSWTIFWPKLTRNITLNSLLNLSAAFDTLDHSILLWKWVLESKELCLLGLLHMFLIASNRSLLLFV